MGARALDSFGKWDPSLALVMDGAIAVSAPGQAYAKPQELDARCPACRPRVPAALSA
jgi:hypothetical protein